AGEGPAGGDDEQIVLLSPEGEAVGVAPKRASHHQDTPLHLAFSCYLVDDAGRVLMTRRAHHKPTWPSVLTNSCCGHPAPGESLRAAVRRRVGQELGVRVGEMALVLPDFSYRATMSNGVVEHELCPVVRAPAIGPLAPDPDEVAEAEWWDWPDCVRLRDADEASPWFREQMARLVPLGGPAEWPEASPDLLPPAVTW
ncbi:isopentenyl-diphosphate Delta-isomerase, partial [Marinitenerispora sediminis]